MGSKKRRSVRNGVFIFSLCQRVDLLGKTRFLAGCGVLMIDVVGRRLIDRLVSGDEEVLRLVRIARCDGVVDAADRTADARLLRDVACAALGVRLYAQNRSLDIRQIVHPLDEKCTALFYHTDIEIAICFSFPRGMDRTIKINNETIDGECRFCMNILP